MKILLISPSIYPSSTGGMEIYNYYFLREIKKLGENISLLSNHSGKIPIDIPQFRLFTKNTFIRSLQVFIHLLFHKYDIVHTPYASNFFLAYPLAFFKLIFKKNDYIIYIHGGGMHKWKNKNIQSLFFKRAKKIISVSEPIKQEYERRVNRSISTILPLIPFEACIKTRSLVRNELGIKESEKFLIYVGSIKPIKGSDFLVNSFLKLGKDFFIKKKIKMVFIGDGILKTDLELSTVEAGMNDFIIFLGKKPKEAVPDYLNAADIFINASHFEGTPLSILEAMNNNLLIISSDVSGINNIIQHKQNGLLYDKENFQSFKEVLEFALINESDCKLFSNNAKNITLKDYDYKKNLLKHLELYAE